MNFLSKKEEEIYNCAGGGEKGESAVLARRKYFEEHDIFMKREMKEIAILHYLPRDEKPYIEQDTIEDYYD